MARDVNASINKCEKAIAQEEKIYRKLKKKSESCARKSKNLKSKRTISLQAICLRRS